MKSNYHVVRQAVANRGLDRTNAKHGGARPGSWAYNDKRERTQTGKVKLIDPAEVPALVVPSRVGVLPRQMHAMKSMLPIKRDK